MHCKLPLAASLLRLSWRTFIDGIMRDSSALAGQSVTPNIDMREGVNPGGYLTWITLDD